MRKKQFLVSKVTKDLDVKGVEVDGQKMEFSKSGSSFYLSDSGKAHALDQALGAGASKEDRQVVISEIPMANKDGVHNYTFSVKKPEIEKGDEESNYIWIDDGKGRQKMVRKDAGIRTS